MIPLLNGRAAAVEPLGGTVGDAERFALVCLHRGVFLRSQYLASSAAPRFVELCTVSPAALYRALGPSTYTLNKKINCALVFDLATARFSATGTPASRCPRRRRFCTNPERLANRADVPIRV